MIDQANSFRLQFGMNFRLLTAFMDGFLPVRRWQILADGNASEPAVNFPAPPIRTLA